MHHITTSTAAIAVLATTAIFVIADWLARVCPSRTDPLDTLDPTSVSAWIRRALTVVVTMMTVLTTVWLILRWSDYGLVVIRMLLGTFAVYVVSKLTEPIVSRLAGSARVLARSALTIALTLGLIAPAFLYPSWLTINTCAVAMSVTVLLLARDIGLKAAVAMLFGIMLYDAIAVYGTDMMLEVAKSSTKTGAQLPLLFIIPRGLDLDAPRAMMLGVADVVLPGLLMMIGAREARRLASAWLWYGPLLGYTVGLIVTILVVNAAQSAQPATIFLIPGALGGLLMAAHATGHGRAIWDSPSREPAAEVPATT